MEEPFLSTAEEGTTESQFNQEHAHRVSDIRCIVPRELTPLPTPGPDRQPSSTDMFSNV